jgi:hypothetical protein
MTSDMTSDISSPLRLLGLIHARIEHVALGVVALDRAGPDSLVQKPGPELGDDREVDGGLVIRAKLLPLKDRRYFGRQLGGDPRGWQVSALQRALRVRLQSGSQPADTLVDALDQVAAEGATEKAGPGQKVRPENV